MGLEDRVRVLEDREAVKELRYEYARCIDDREWDSWPELFTDDARCRFEGWGEHRGKVELRAFMAETISQAFEYTAHIMHHPVISIDGDTGSGSWYTEIYYALADDDIAGWRQGRYFDEYRRVDGEWKFESVEHTFFARKLSSYSQTDDVKYGDLIEFGQSVDAK